jgi:hypothetical protein
VSSLMSHSFRALTTLSSLFPVAKQMVPSGIRRNVYKFLLSKVIVRYPDRVFMREEILPFILRQGVPRVLTVGVQSYTVEIMDLLTAGGVKVSSLDIDPEAQRYGAPGRHIIGDATRIDEIDGTQGFPCILFNGVLGFGIDRPEDIRRTFVALSNILPPDGLLVLGWNTDRIPDPMDFPEFRRFRHIQDESLPRRVTFPESTHVYDFLELDRTAPEIR